LQLRLPLWSSGQSFWLQIQRSWFRFPALPDFLASSGSGMGSTQPREDNWGATWRKSSGSGLENRHNDRGNPLRWPPDTLYPQKVGTTSPTSGGHSVGIVRSRTKATEFSLVFSCCSWRQLPKWTNKCDHLWHIAEWKQLLPCTVPTDVYRWTQITVFEKCWRRMYALCMTAVTSVAFFFFCLQIWGHLMAVSIMITIFCDVMLCRSLDCYQHSGGTCRLLWTISTHLLTYTMSHSTGL
jgi:hypothetical protein